MIRKQRVWVAPRPGETRRSGFKSLRPHALSQEVRAVIISGLPTSAGEGLESAGPSSGGVQVLPGFESTRCRGLGIAPSEC